MVPPNLNNDEFCPVRLRNMGNEHYKKDEYVIAISCYTKSLARSPAGSRLRGLAYANRSAVLLSLGHYKESLADAQTALANDYPQEMAFKLYMRMGICKKMMGKKSEAAEDFLLSIQKVDEDDALGIEKKKELKREVMKQSMEERNPRFPQVFAEYLKPPKLSYGPNPLEPKISSAVVKQKESTSLVAKHRIEVGDVLAIEDPLAYSPVDSVKFKYFGIHCSECFKMCLNLSPCTSCSWAYYCSEECSKASWEKFHRTGCAAMENLLEKLCKEHNNYQDHLDTVKSAFLCIAAFGLENCIAAYQNQGISDNAPKVVKDFINGNMYHDFDDSVKNLVIYELVAESLQLTGGKKKSLVSFLNHMITKSAIFRNNLLGITHVSVFCDGSGTLETYSLHIAGNGIYQMLGAVDRSCDPNLIIGFYQKTLVIRALRPIKEGEKLYMPNGTGFHFNPLEIRQQWSLVTRRKKKCYCAACTGNWRTQPDQPFCHYTSIQNSTLVWRFLDLDSVSFHGALLPFPLLAVSAVTTERYKDSIKIRSLYEDRRRDDHLSLMTSNFLRIFYSSSAMRFTVGSPVGDRLDHYLVPFVPNRKCTSLGFIVA